MILYHYTSTHHLPFILQAGVLRVTDSNLSMHDPGMEPRVVWLLDTPVAAGPHGLDGSPVDKRGVRFTVDVPAIKWTNWLPAIQADPDWKATIVKVGGGVEAADHWYVWPGPIRRGRWREVAVLRDGRYVPMPGGVLVS